MGRRQPPVTAVGRAESDPPECRGAGYRQRGDLGGGGACGAPAAVRKFGTFTPDLEALADWLAACGVDTVAMESTGVYWIPVYEILEARASGVRGECRGT